MHIDIIHELKRIDMQLNNLVRIIKKEKGLIQYYRRYYNKEHGRVMRSYLRKSDIETIKGLAQKSFDQNILKAALKQKETIRSFLKHYNLNVLKDIYQKTSPERKKLIHAEIVDDETYALNWEKVDYHPAEFKNAAPEYYTLKGEKVRSKSEKIIADTLFTKKIPYYL